MSITRPDGCDASGIGSCVTASRRRRLAFQIGEPDEPHAGAPDAAGPTHRPRPASARRSSCSAGCRAATTRCRRRSASGRTRAGAARWSTRSRLRAASASSTWRPAPAWWRRSCCARPTARSWRSTRAPRCWPAPGPASPLCRRRTSSSSRARPSGCRSPDASFDALTFTYLLRYVDDPPATMRELARVLRPGGTHRLARVRRPAVRPARAAWRLYTAVGLPALGRVVLAASGRRSGASSAPASAASTSAIRSSGSSATGARRGSSDVAVRRMSLGGGVVMSARRAPGPAGDG